MRILGSSKCSCQYVVAFPTVDWAFVFSVPFLADDDFVLQLATLLYNEVPTNLRVYIEYSNEVTNFRIVLERSIYAEQIVVELWIFPVASGLVLRFHGWIIAARLLFLLLALNTSQ